MAYRLEIDEQVIVGVRRIAHRQSERALAALNWTSDTETDPHTDNHTDTVEDGIHECRKRCKRIRGLIRLVRPALGEDRYHAANTTYRDAARVLSPYRDAHALLATFDDLVAAHVRQFAGINTEPIRDELVRRAQERTTSLQDDRGAAAVRDARTMLEHARDTIDEWDISCDGWEAIAGGVAKTYARGRSALATAIEAPTDHNFHRWRKRAKYTWNHLRLLQRSAPDLIAPFAAQFHSLSDSLGDAHDLSVLHAQLHDDVDAFGGNERVRDVAVVIDGTRVDLERESVGAGRRLYAERPKHLTRRLGAYWETWRESGSPPA